LEPAPKKTATPPVPWQFNPYRRTPCCSGADPLTGRGAMAARQGVCGKEAGLDFDLTRQQEMIRKEVRKFAESEIAP
jgi:hypothetical protein